MKDKEKDKYKSAIEAEAKKYLEFLVPKERCNIIKGDNFEVYLTDVVVSRNPGIPFGAAKYHPRFFDPLLNGRGESLILKEGDKKTEIKYYLGACN